MIVPAILTDKRDKFSSMLAACAAFTDYVQIDIMDGVFVPSKSIGSADLEGIVSPVDSEAHLMVEDPFSWIDSFKKLGAKRIIFHIESKVDHFRIIEKIKKEGLQAGVAVNPATEISAVASFIAEIDVVLFLSVNPGFYGAPFIPQVLDKIRDFKRKYPTKLAGIDGGVKLSNVKQVVSCGVDYICVGSAILNADNPSDEYANLLRQIKEDKG